MRYCVPMPTPSRGNRKSIHVRPPIDQHRFYAERAAELGIAVGSYAAMRLAQADGLPVPDFVVDELEKARRQRAEDAASRRAEQLSILEEDESDPVRRGMPLARSA